MAFYPSMFLSTDILNQRDVNMKWLKEFFSMWDKDQTNFNRFVSSYIGLYGSLDMVKYFHEQGEEFDYKVLCYAIIGYNVHILQYFHENIKSIKKMILPPRG